MQYLSVTTLSLALSYKIYVLLYFVSCAKRLLKYDIIVRKIFKT